MTTHWLTTGSGATLSKSQKKKNKKKNAAKKAEEADKPNGSQQQQDTEEHEDEAEDDNDDHTAQHVPVAVAQKSTAQPTDPDADEDDVDDQEPPLSPTIAQTNGTQRHSISSAVALGFSRSRSQQGLSPSSTPPPPSDTTARLEAVARERDALRQEVTELRKSLESIQSKHQADSSDDVRTQQHQAELQSLREELEEANEGKEHFETQYKNLLGRVNTIKTSLGDRLKADAVRSQHAL